MTTKPDNWPWLIKSGIGIIIKAIILVDFKTDLKFANDNSKLLFS